MDVREIVLEKLTEKLEQVSEESRKMFFDFVEQDFVISLINVFNFATNSNVRMEYSYLLSKGYEKQYALIMANIESVYKRDLRQIVRILSFLNLEIECEYISNSIVNLLNVFQKEGTDIEAFITYLGKLDFEEIAKIAPVVKEYNAKAQLIFAVSHYKKGTIKFDEKALKFDKDLTDYLKKVYLQASEMNALLIAYPLTSRRIGVIPSDWFGCVKDENLELVKNAIYETVLKFNLDRDVESFETSMQGILNKKVQMNETGSGGVGVVYRLIIEGAKDTCLKVYHRYPLSMKCLYLMDKTIENIVNAHGVYIEPQIGMFANANSNKFVKMHFGLVSAFDLKQNDGFTVTEYISEEMKPTDTICSELNSYVFVSEDIRDDNVINGKVIDFGAVIVRKKNLPLS